MDSEKEIANKLDEKQLPLNISGIPEI